MIIIIIIIISWLDSDGSSQQSRIPAAIGIRAGIQRKEKQSYQGRKILPTGYGTQ